MLNKIMRLSVVLIAASPGAQVAAQTSIPPSAPDFAISAAQSDTYEIEADQDALGQSKNPQIRAFARQVIEDHTRMADSLR